MEKYADVDASELSPGTSDPESTQRSDTAGLDLKSTIIGVNRRAAYINRKLYFEGSTVEIDGESYKLVSVSPGKAVLRRGYETVELTIPESGPSRHAELDADGGARRR